MLHTFAIAYGWGMSQVDELSYDDAQYLLKQIALGKAQSARAAAASAIRASMR